MAKPTQAIFPIQNGKLLTVLDANGFQIENLDTSNLGLVGGGGNDTGTTTAILKGDGNHGFADALADTDYASVSLVGNKEDIADHNADITTINDAIDVIESDIIGINFSIGVFGTELATKAEQADLDSTDATVATLSTAIGNKADSASVSDALALKADQTDLDATDATIAALTTAVGNKADSASVSDALALKANASDVTTSLAGKEPLLPTTANDAYILARHNAGAGSSWFFVDPLTLGTTSQSFADGVENSTTTFTSASANFVANDVGKAITGTNIPAGTTIASRTNPTTIILSAAATATASSIPFTIINRIEVGGSGTVTSVGVTNNVTGLFTTSIANATTTPQVTIDPATVGANTFYGNFTAFAGQAGFGAASFARTALGGTTVGQALFQLANPSAVGYPRIDAGNTVTFRTTAQTLSDLGAESVLTFTSPISRATNTVSMTAASSIVSGYLTNTDYSTFSSKVGPTRTISTTAPLTGGGDLSANRTIAMPAATAAVDGYLTAANFASFNSKVSSTRTITTTSPLTGGGDLSADRTLSIPAANQSNSGYLTAADYSVFLAKPPNTRTISTTAPLTGGGDLSANRTLAMPAATSLVDGYLRAVDFSSFARGAAVTQLAGTGGTLVMNPSANPPVNRVLLNQVLTSQLAITLPPATNYLSGFGGIEIIDIVGGAMANFGVLVNSASGDTIDGVLQISLPRGSGYQRFNSNGGTKWFSTNYFTGAFVDPTTPTKRVVVDVSGISPAETKTLTITRDSVTVGPGISNDAGEGGELYRSMFVAGISSAGQLVFDAPLPDVSAAEGKVLTVTAGVPTWEEGTSPWQALSVVSNTIAWTPIAGQRIQNARVTLTANATLAISSTNLSGGMEFNLLVTSGGNFTLTPPSGTFVGTNGLGVLPQDKTSGAKDWHRFNYIGSPGLDWLHTRLATNMTTTAVVACSTAGTTGGQNQSAGGSFSSIGIGALTNGNNNYVANTVESLDTACCRIDAHLYKQGNGGANVNLIAAIYTDVARATSSTGVTTSGSSTLTVGTGIFVSTDVGQRITVSGGGLGSTVLYVGALLSSTQVTLSSTKTTNTPYTGATPATGLTVNVFGRPGAPVAGGTSTNTVAAGSLPLYASPAAATAAGATGADNAHEDPTSFTGLSASLTVGTTYHIVLSTLNSGDPTNNARWIFGQTDVVGYNMLTNLNGLASPGSGWLVNNSSPRKMRFTLYHV